MSPTVVPTGPSTCTYKATPAQQDCSQFPKQTALVPQPEPESASKTSHWEWAFKVMEQVSVRKEGKEGRKVEILGRSARFPWLWVLALSAQQLPKTQSWVQRRQWEPGGEDLKTGRVFALRISESQEDSSLHFVFSGPWSLPGTWALVSFFYQGVAVAHVHRVCVGQEVSASALSGSQTALPWGHHSKELWGASGSMGFPH